MIQQYPHRIVPFFHLQTTLFPFPILLNNPTSAPISHSGQTVITISRGNTDSTFNRWQNNQDNNQQRSWIPINQILLSFLRSVGAVITSLLLKPQQTFQINHFLTNFEHIITKTTSVHHFASPYLTESEMKLGYRLGTDSYADTSVAGRHNQVIDFVEGKKLLQKLGITTKWPTST